MDELTNLSTLRELCARHSFTFSKSYGQNFLINPAICPKICDAAGLGPQSEVLEVGPGFGTLTRELAKRAKAVVSLEKDARLLPVLAETLAGCPNAAVLHGDVLKTDLAKLLQTHFTGRATVCANLPYNITSPVLMALLEGELPLESVTVMVQQEAAERITAAPGTREAGAISYAVHYYTRPKLCFTVKPGSFYPPPKVTSAVIRLVPRKDPPFAGDDARRAQLFRLVRAAFAQRRKTLVNAASAGLQMEKQRLAAAMGQAGLGPMLRPEQLTLENYCELVPLLWPAGG